MPRAGGRRRARPWRSQGSRGIHTDGHDTAPCGQRRRRASCRARALHELHELRGAEQAGLQRDGAAAAEQAEGGDAADLEAGGEVDARLAALAALAGPGSKQARRDGVAALLATATATEAAFLRALLVGEVRQGALAALVVEAAAVASEVPLATVRTAYMLAGELGAVVAAALRR